MIRNFEPVLGLFRLKVNYIKFSSCSSLIQAQRLFKFEVQT